MPRPDPIIPPPAVTPRADNSRITETRHYRLITPLFGGGVEPMQADPITVVRAPSIRGQLRFWWRATRGGQFNGDLQAMKDAEARLWGAASTAKQPRPAKVEIVVTSEPASGTGSENVVRPFHVVPGRPSQRGVSRPQVRPTPGAEIHPYAAFPLQPNEREAGYGVGMTTRSVRRGVEFRLKLAYPYDWQDHDEARRFPAATVPGDEIAAALWAWETFGGLGGRTRRGFGAVQFEGGSGGRGGQSADIVPDRPASQTFWYWLHDHLMQYGTAGPWPDNVPHLSTDLDVYAVVDGQWQDAAAPWNHLIEQLNRFRQWRPGPPNDPGRSQWPEPDSIRLQLGMHTEFHQPRLKTRKYPRAAFGLPIVVHFKDAPRGHGGSGRFDPADSSIQGREGYERLASPLVLRSLSCSDGAVVGLAVVLDVPRVPPGGLALKHGGGLDPIESRPLTMAEVQQMGYLGSHLAQAAGAQGTVDILLAFLNFLDGGSRR